MTGQVESLEPLLEPLLEGLLSSRVRVRVLAALLGTDGAQTHARELSRQTGEHFNAVWQELKHLEALGLLVTEKAGNAVRYSMNPACPLLPELRALIRKGTAAGTEAPPPSRQVAAEARTPLAAKRPRPAAPRSFVIGEVD